MKSYANTIGDNLKAGVFTSYEQDDIGRNRSLKHASPENVWPSDQANTTTKRDTSCPVSLRIPVALQVLIYTINQHPASDQAILRKQIVAHHLNWSFRPLGVESGVWGVIAYSGFHMWLKYASKVCLYA